MAVFRITPSGGSNIDFAELSGASSPMATTGKYWPCRPRPSTPRYGVQTGKGPSVDGQRVKRFGFDELDIDNIELIYVSDSVANVISAWKTDQAAIVNKACTLTIPDFSGTFVACECLVFEQKVYPGGRIVKPTFQSSKYRMHVLARFKQFRTS